MRPKRSRNSTNVRSADPLAAQIRRAALVAIWALWQRFDAPPAHGAGERCSIPGRRTATTPRCAVNWIGEAAGRKSDCSEYLEEPHAPVTRCAPSCAHCASRTPGGAAAGINGNATAAPAFSRATRVIAAAAMCAASTPKNSRRAARVSLRPKPSVPRVTATPGGMYARERSPAPAAVVGGGDHRPCVLASRSLGEACVSSAFVSHAVAPRQLAQLVTLTTVTSLSSASCWPPCHFGGDTSGWRVGTMWFKWLTRTGEQTSGRGDPSVRTPDQATLPHLRSW